MWELFKDKNEYNEKNIIGFLSNIEAIRRMQSAPKALDSKICISSIMKSFRKIGK